MLLDLRTDFEVTATDSNSTIPSRVGARDGSQLLVDVCIAFAILETFFIIAFILSWHLNRDNNTNNTKGVYGLILAGYIFCFGGVVIGILKITIGGAGHHMDTLPPATIRRMLKLIKAHEVIYVLSIPFPKLAILCLYLRLFTARLSRWILYATGLIVIATAVFGFVATFSNCRPFQASWDPSLEERCTMKVMTVFRFYSVPNIATDAVMIVLPLPALYRLNVSTLAKVGVGFTFFICTLGIVTSILRFVAFLNVEIFDDVTYLCISSTSWTIIEPGVYLIAATVPTLQPLVRRFLHRIPPRSISRHTTRHQALRSASFKMTAPDTAIERPRLTKKQSEKEMERRMIATIGRTPSRNLRLDDYHNLQYGGSGVFGLRSEDDEGMLCTDAIIQETMRRQGRNADGTLRAWSLQPILVSPLRTSFYFEDEGCPRR